MMERFGRGVVMSWREKNIKTEEQGGRGREVEKRGSGVLVLVFVCGKISLGSALLSQEMYFPFFIFPSLLCVKLFPDLCAGYKDHDFVLSSSYFLGL
ncbi:hypothetical protein J6590_099279 [Homalodisca vitripennis]|nr:hypothetical protein J6590_099279 [Homalodisca vitripennis]